MEIPFRTLTVEVAEEQLADKALDVQDTAEAVAEAERALSDAHSADASADVVLKAEADLQKSKVAHERAIKAHDAAQERLDAALDARDAKEFHLSEKKLNTALKSRLDAAQILDSTSKERAHARKLLEEADTVIQECKAVGAVSVNAAAGSQYGPSRTATLIELTDVKAGVVDNKFMLAYPTLDAIPSAVDSIKVDNKTILGE